MANKVKFGLKNVYYAKLTEASDGTVTYETPAAIKGAVNLSLSPSGETTSFYADDVEYYTSIQNNGYEGTLEVAILPDSYKEDILNETKDANGVYTESSGIQPERHALMFEFDGDANAVRHVIYNCKPTRPNVEGGTKTNTADPQTETVNLTIKPLADGKVKARTTSETPTATYNSWFSSVYMA